MAVSAAGGPRLRRSLGRTLAGVLLLGCVFGMGRAALRWREDAAQANQAARGAQVYAGECASCHGANLEGQPRWWEPGADGLLPAPPHDATGHSWQHSDAELVRLVTEGPTVFAAPGYRSAMPAYAGRLPLSDILAVVAYIKGTWPAGVRAYQATLNPGGPSFADLPGDWTFPPTCNLELGPPRATTLGQAGN